MAYYDYRQLEEATAEMQETTRYMLCHNGSVSPTVLLLPLASTFQHLFLGPHLSTSVNYSQVIAYFLEY